MEIKKSILVRKNICLLGIIIDMFILIIFLISMFDVVFDFFLVKVSVINIVF